MKPYSILYDAKPAVQKILDVMSEQDAKEFVRHLSHMLHFSLHSLNEAVQSTIRDWGENHEVTPEIQDAINASGPQIAARDAAFAVAALQCAPAETIVQEALERMRQQCDQIGVPAEKFAQFEQGILSEPIEITPGWTYEQLYHLADNHADIITHDEAWIDYWQDCKDAYGGIKSAATEWSETVSTQVSIATHYGGYSFKNYEAEYCAGSAEDTFSMLSFQQRYELSRLIEENIDVGYGNLAPVFARAVEQLPEDLREDLQNIIERDRLSMYYDDMDRADYR